MELLDLVNNYINGNANEAVINVMTGFYNSVMEEETKKKQCGSDYYERCEGRTDQRKGYRERTLKTSIGVLTLQKPQLRKTPFKTCVFDSHSRIDKALQSSILESYIKGVSTRNVPDIISTLGNSEISAVSVSRIAKTLDETVETFLKRPIEKPTPYLFIDATYCKIREDNRYVTKALYIAVGVNEDGYREILGAKLADSESEEYWSAFFGDLINCGLTGVKLVISDGHKSIRKAVIKMFVGAS